jgi:hypothetical protein
MVRRKLTSLQYRQLVSVYFAASATPERAIVDLIARSNDTTASDTHRRIDVDWLLEMERGMEADISYDRTIVRFPRLPRVRSIGKHTIDAPWAAAA